MATANEHPELQIKNVEQLLRDWFSDNKPRTLTILITGKTGVGKSRLVNALVGQNVAPEGGDLDPCTSEVTSYEVVIENVKVVVWDSPGLQDGTTNEDLYIQDMKTRVKDIDLMIYCMKMDDTRFYDADKKAIQILTEEFGKEVWNHAVVVLTFANKVEDPDEGDELQYFQKQLNNWKKQLKDHFRVVNLEVDIPVIPVGKWRKMRLPDRENWLSDLWIECYQTMKASARQGMYRINRNRVKFIASTATREASATGYNSAVSDPSTLHIPITNQNNKHDFWKSTWEAASGIGKLFETFVYTIIQNSEIHFTYNQNGEYQFNFHTNPPHFERETSSLQQLFQEQKDIGY